MLTGAGELDATGASLTAFASATLDPHFWLPAAARLAQVFRTGAGAGAGAAGVDAGGAGAVEVGAGGC